jgi:hypothetical protein
MEKNDSGNGIGTQILSTSANMIGICFVIISFVYVSGISHKTLLDEFCAITMLLFLASCILSYCSIRSMNNKIFFERYADSLFILALGFMGIASILIVLGIII